METSFEEELEGFADDLAADVSEADEFDRETLDTLVARCLVFIEYLVGHELFDYQRLFASRIIESILTNDGETVTFLCSRQAGKTESVANTLAGMMILLPRLARIFPNQLDKFKNGFWVGCFAPINEQVETLYGRIVDRLTSERAVEIMLDPEIDDKPVGGGKFLKLANSGSFVRMQTANPRAKIESKSYHMVVGDESQEIDEFMWNKSIMPMLAFYNGSAVMTGTPAPTKGVFYRNIQHNKRRAARRGGTQNHFEFNWRACARNNANYGKFIAKEMERIGEDSDEFQMSYNLRWLLDRGMFASEQLLDELGDVSMQLVKGWAKTPVVVGIDPARKMDSTVVTVVWVDWDRPDEFGFYDHRILNWMEIQGDDWEEQYFQIVDFLRPYNLLRVGVDAQGVGDAIAGRLARLLPRAEVVPVMSDPKSQSERWKHLMELMQRRRVGWPAHAKTRRLRSWKRFRQQMEDLEKIYQGQYMLAAAPDVADAHDDYPDSLAIACMMTKMDAMPQVEVTNSPFVGRRLR